MKRLRLELQLLAPTCISERPAVPGQIATTLSHVSGAVVRAGLAARWLAGRSVADLDDAGWSTFSQLFLDGQMRYDAGLPLGERELGDTTWVVPQTAWTAKHSDGWIKDGGSGVRDVLVNLLRDGPDDRDALLGLERLGQEFALHNQATNEWRAVSIRKRMITRAAVNRVGDRALPLPSRGVVAESQLATFEALEAGQYFGAVVSGPDDRLDELASTVARQDEILALGRGRSRGNGEAAVTYVEAIEDDPRDPAELANRARDFTKRAGVRDDSLYLPVTLESDLILRDRYLLPCTSGAPEETLNRYQPSAPTTMQLRFAMQRTHWVGGWDMIRGVPRAPVLAVRRGGVWVYRVSETELDAAIAWWLAAERDGLGERRNQGYGRVRLLHPFHTAAEDSLW